MAGRDRLSLRKEVILRALVEHYVRTGEPVPSRLISDQLASVYGPGYGPATVRNELVALEEDGLILQPHISAGRIPTDLGYRYFVERLMGESQLALEEQRLTRNRVARCPLVRARQPAPSRGRQSRVGSSLDQ